MLLFQVCLYSAMRKHNLGYKWHNAWLAMSEDILKEEERRIMWTVKGALCGLTSYLIE